MLLRENQQGIIDKAFATLPANLPAASLLPQFQLDQSFKAPFLKEGIDTVFRSQRLVYYQGGWVPAIAMEYYSMASDPGSKELIINQHGEILRERDLESHKHASSDTTWATVFLPDPLSRTNRTYGPPYADFNDSRQTWLTQARDTVRIPITRSGSNYLLENNWVEIVERDPPVNTVCTSTLQPFYYDRDQQCFEQVNAFYHITAFQQWLQELGFSTLDSKVEVDAQAHNGNDVSSYSAMFNLLKFGEGGVDDAEDADVIIHEYGHALFHQAAPTSFKSVQRSVLEEGSCDFLATAWSEKLLGTSQLTIFNWDGENEFWGGRSVSATKTYPDDYVGLLYDDGEIWSSTLNAVAGQIGIDTTLLLLMESVFSYTSVMLLPDGAKAFMEADSSLFNKAHWAKTAPIFVSRGLLDSSYVVDVSPKLWDLQVQILNSSNFQHGQALKILLPGHINFVRLEVFAISGKEVEIKSEQRANEIVVSAEGLKKGLYVFWLHTNQGSLPIKVLR